MKTELTPRIRLSNKTHTNIALTQYQAFDTVSKIKALKRHRQGREKVGTCHKIPHVPFLVDVLSSPE